MADSAFALVFPAGCPLCAQEHTLAGWVGLCEACWRQIQPWSGPACAGCGLPFAAPSAEGESLCGVCRRGEYEFEFARSYGLYAEPLRSAILLVKFQRRERLGLRLGELMAPVWAAQREFREAEQPILVAVPLHRSRQRERGFNQAEVLARGLVRGLKTASSGMPPQVDTRLLERVRTTVPQTGLSFKERRENVRGVFKVAAPDRVRGRVVVLVDDVMTTGATLSSCASALKDAKAHRVLAITLARATPQFPDAASPSAAEAVDDFG